jgi:hypothetical protein
LSVLDSLGNTYFSTETIKNTKQVTTYTISLITTTTTPVNNEISLVNNYETAIKIKLFTKKRTEE